MGLFSWISLCHGGSGEIMPGSYSLIPDSGLLNVDNAHAESSQHLGGVTLLSPSSGSQRSLLPRLLVIGAPVAPRSTPPPSGIGPLSLGDLLLEYHRSAETVILLPHVALDPPAYGCYGWRREISSDPGNQTWWWLHEEHWHSIVRQNNIYSNIYSN